MSDSLIALAPQITPAIPFVVAIAKAQSMRGPGLTRPLLTKAVYQLHPTVESAGHRPPRHMAITPVCTGQGVPPSCRAVRPPVCKGNAVPRLGSAEVRARCAGTTIDPTMWCEYFYMSDKTWERNCTVGGNPSPNSLPIVPQTRYSC